MTIGKKLRSDNKQPSIKLNVLVPRRHVEAEHVAAGWPSWLTQCAADVVHGWLPLSADAYEKSDKVI